MGVQCQPGIHEVRGLLCLLHIPVLYHYCCVRTPMVLEGKRIAMSRFNELPDEVRRQYQPDFMGDTDKLHGLLEVSEFSS